MKSVAVSSIASKARVPVWTSRLLLVAMGICQRLWQASVVDRRLSMGQLIGELNKHYVTRARRTK